MKLATFTQGGRTRIGVVEGEQVLDISASGTVPTEMISLIEGGEQAMDGLRQVAGKATSFPLSAVALEAPVPSPGKILAIGLNYADHIEETGLDKPKEQIWFNKQRGSVNGPYADVNMPSVSHYLDYEAELVMVIGKRAKHVPRERAHEVVFGYMCGNDVSVRDWQLATPTMTMGKSFDTHGPTGPWIVTADEIGDPHDLDFTCHVNGEEKQRSNTKHMVFDCWDQIAHLSRAFTLEPGDLIFTGTSGGVGVAMKPPVFRQVGDVMKVAFDRIGTIENRIVAEKAETLIA
ncbi:fumarylacetoacetate hydrolase family protein [Parvularcula maris]|uniref:Fumarylacetoacetate hydrolase family protein n=1 Tax=Parvularcula maris TaxID=2965077 RepID=A0A9X2RKR3_9PROT|nr:fumarylacetoacetate hydrolase family protein [Parvularcula maris]MCQ8185867.1 fumarylacetoacetate hydrolase family protein [Parvularcula maris]